MPTYLMCDPGCLAGTLRFSEFIQVPRRRQVGPRVRAGFMALCGLYSCTGSGAQKWPPTWFNVLLSPS